MKSVYKETLVRHLLLLVFPLCAASGAFAAMPLPSLKLFADGMFEPGLWHVEPLDADSRARVPDGQSICLADAGALALAGMAPADSSCVHTIVNDAPDRATITYICKGRGSGRTTIFRDARNHFTVDAQGIAGREPFAMRGEYRRIGDCTAGQRQAGLAQR